MMDKLLPRTAVAATILMIGCFATNFANAQSLEVTPFTGYTLRSTFDIRGGQARVYGDQTFGGIVTYNLNPRYGIEFTYSRQPTEADARSIHNQDFGVPVNVVNFLVGGLRQLPVSDQVIPFGGFQLGVAGYVPQVRGYDDGWLFAVGAKVGSKFMFSETVGLRLQAAMNMPVQGFGSSFYFGTGGGGVGVNAYSSIFQFTFTGGLILRLAL
ncbi:MAG: hypothetical protein ACFB15_19260 [Cyclobacteriaceae bacterium]